MTETAADRRASVHQVVHNAGGFCGVLGVGGVVFFGGGRVWVGC